MQITIFSVWITILWSSILILIFYFLRKKLVLLNVCSVSGVLILYIFCIIRLLIPIELPWTKELWGGELYNWVYEVVRYEVVSGINIYQMFGLIWMAGAFFFLIKLTIRYIKLTKMLDRIPVKKDERTESILTAVLKDKEKRPEIVKTSAIQIPCCVGVFHKRILIPAKEYSDEELHYIILHEHTHLKNNDVLTKLLINSICAVYWWNPLVYLLRKDMQQSLEIRCDGQVSKKMDSISRSNYLAVMLAEFKDNCHADEFKKYHSSVMPLFEEHSEKLIERFQLVSDRKNGTSVRGNLVATAIAICLLMASYSFVLQSQYACPIEEIETDDISYSVDSDNSYIAVRDGEYILHTGQKEVVLAEEMAEMMIEEGFLVIEE
ncbi:MAG: M56 family metallopeptidase [Lachnospiraceae bacterium]|nr:M56 family metallopeptidase [Lachnospiraceae bacterium]